MQDERDRPDAQKTTLAVEAADEDMTARPAPLDDRYERRGLLGVGGMGEVHLCLDRVIGREVALKRLGGAMSASKRALARFTREALVHARLEHPAIVPVYDVSLDMPERAWFTMKRIRGRSLFEILTALREGDADTVAAYSRHKLLTAFVQICLAIDYAHSRGVIHRDLKPGNLMLGDFGEVNVLDWGIAKIVGDAEESMDLGDEWEDQTQAGTLMGTAGYMAPEQARGAIELVGRATDVYALGAILFEILTLEPLHAGTAQLALLTATMQGVDARPSSRGHQVAPELEAACVRATSLAPGDRFPSARELAHAVERFLEGDRDVARRRELAEEQVEKAKAAMARSDPEARTDALRELGRAVALDPAHETALDLLASALIDPPARLPDAAREELGRVRGMAYRTAMRLASYRYLLWLAFVPLVYWMGIRSFPIAIAITALLAITALETLRRARKAEPRMGDAIFLLVASCVSIATASTVFGPFLLIPGLAATNTLFMAMHGPRRSRTLVLVCGALTIALPYAAQALGIVPASHRFTAEGLLIVPQVARFPELATTVTLLTTAIATVVIPGILAGRMHDALKAAEKRLFVQEWHLRQLLPKTVRREFAPHS